jgi:hypothetical protein
VKVLTLCDQKLACNTRVDQIIKKNSEKILMRMNKNYKVRVRIRVRIRVRVKVRIRLS